MTDTTDVQKILNKIALLKNLRDRPGTPEEAAAAAGKIQDLMTKYNLTMFQVDAATRSREGAEGPIQRWFDHTYAAWRFHLLAGIGRANFVRVLHGGEFVLIGHRHNVDLTIQLFEYLEPEIERLATIAWKESDKESKWRWVGDNWKYGPPSGKAWKNNFRYGAASTVSDRLMEQRQETVAAATSSALVPVIQEEVNNAVKTWYPKLGRAKGGYGGNGVGGYAQGVEAGRGINLAKQIG
jgi:hypothetical protein